MVTKSTGKKARSLMLQGTGSHVGKSILCAALLRILRDKGLSVAPFKAQNMALNSAVTPDGGEIGRAQFVQAEAAGVVPSVDMNPILLKPTGDAVSQVIIHGKVFASMGAVEYHAFKKEAARFVMESYERLSSNYDVIVIEGAGSPAEVNLRENDIANMGVAELTDSPVVIVGDIDRGGVFASLVGTMELLSPAERGRVKGFIINKFRGDVRLLKGGLDFLTQRTGVPVVGVVPYMTDINLPDEDGVALQGVGSIRGDSASHDLDIAVVKLPRISNFTDFDPFRHEPSVRIRFVDNVRDLEGADAVILPGTKNTIEDLLWLKSRGFDKRIKEHREAGGTVVGVCGGFQMLGEKVSDPYSVESGAGVAEGLSMLRCSTILRRDKKTHSVSAIVCAGAMRIEGYEIHMGETTGIDASFSMIDRRDERKASIDDGAVSGDGLVWGTYIHGVFDNDIFRDTFLSGLRAGNGAGMVASPRTARRFADIREESMDALASMVKASVDIDALLKIIGG